jgi:hypothetical protein
MAAAELRINHASRTAANVAAMLDDDLTSDVIFVIADEIGADVRGSSQQTTLQRVDVDVGVLADRPSSQLFVCRHRKAVG